MPVNNQAIEAARFAGENSMTEWPTRCISNSRFAETFPVTLKRAGVKQIGGTVIGPSGLTDVYHVKWDHLKRPWRLHKQYFQFVKATPITEGSTNAGE